MKKAQMSEFIGVTLIVLALVIFIMFTRIGSTNKAIKESESFTLDFERRNLWQGADSMLYTTIDGMMMTELLGHFACYNTTTMSFRQGLLTNVSEIIYTTLNNYYGRWALELQNACFTKHGTVYRRCDLSGEHIKSFRFIYPVPCKTGIEEGVLYVIR